MIRFVYGFILGVLTTVIAAILYLAFAGGEYLLWIIKDFRRAGARTGLTEALRSEHRRPGLSGLVEALESFKDVDATEKQVRGLPGGK